MTKNERTTDYVCRSSAMSVPFARFTDSEHIALDRIVERALPLFKDWDGVTELHLRMDISAAHASNPLRLAELAEADDFNLIHDIGGIIRHLDRTTGFLQDCFVPRYSRRGG